jgi:hypothetical protein
MFADVVSHRCLPSANGSVLYLLMTLVSLPYIKFNKESFMHRFDV